MAKYALIFLGLGLFFSACHSKKGGPASKMDPKDTLSLALPFPIEKLDWNMSTDLASRIIETNLMDGLTTIDVQGSNVDVVPALAESWDKNAGGLEYIFHLREGVEWSDGKPLLAQQFVDSFQRLLTSSSPWAESLFVIKGARSFHEGKVKNFKEVGVEALGEKTLKISLNEPVPYFLALFSHHSTFPIRKDLVEGSSSWSRPDKLVTLGAFEVETYENDHRLVLKRNDHYPLKRPLLKTLDLRVGIKPSEAVDLFKSSEVAAVIDVPSQEVKDVSDREEIFYTPLLDVTYLTFNVRQKPLDNPIFRRAIGMSIDRDELVHALGDSMKPIGGMVPPGLVGYESNRGVRFDPDAAKELLHHSGYANLEKYDPLYLRVNLSSEGKVAAGNVLAQLKRALNIDIKLALSDDDLPKNARTIYLSHWAASVPDPDNFLALFTSMSLNNPTGWKNRNYDEFVRQAATTPSVESREKLYAKAQHILTETEMPVVPLFLNTQFCLVNRKIRNFPLNPLGFMPFKGVSVEGK
jgi:oligopeptide transport system substrate-binding protein